MQYKVKNNIYNINVHRTGKKTIILDGSEIIGGIVPFLNGGEHNVEVTI